LSFVVILSLLFLVLGWMGDYGKGIISFEGKGRSLLLDRKAEMSGFACQALVNCREGVQFALDIGLILLVQIYFEEARAVEAEAGSLADDFGGIDNVLEKGVVHCGQRAASRSLLSLHVVVAGGLGKDRSLSDDKYVLSAEFLLQLADQSGLNLAKLSQQLVRNEEDDGLLPGLPEGDLAGGEEMEGAEVGAEIGGVGFDLVEGVDDGLLDGGQRGVAALLLDLPVRRRRCDERALRRQGARFGLLGLLLLLLMLLWL